MGLIGLVGLQPTQQQPPPPPQPSVRQTVAPASGSSASGGTNDNASSNDTGPRNGGGQPAYRDRPVVPSPPSRPAEATARSVVQAQSEGGPFSPFSRLPVNDNAARVFAIDAQARARDRARIAGIAAPRELPEPHKPATSATLPDPLPTAPILKNISRER